MSVLRVDRLQTHFMTRAGVVPAVDGVSLQVARGEVVGLVGESGSGKSVFGFSVLGLVDEPGRIVGGSIRLGETELVGLSERQWRTIRGKRVMMIFQDPMMTLNPVLRVDTQMIEAVRAHERVSERAARQRAREALAAVGIPAPEERLKAYPHQFSGGMRQRVAIATALLNKPDLIIADEPTTALDVTIQGQILYEIQRLTADTGTSLIWITHDLTVVAGLADRVAVMYAGKIVEEGTTDAVLDAPRHPYTVGLIGSVPSHNARGKPLAQIAGMTPTMTNLPDGCRFRPRCPRASNTCLEMPALEPVHGALARCHHPHRPDQAAA